MNNLRKYGKAPFTIAVIHGGPGAAGEMAPVARHLASRFGVLEPLQTATTLDGQVEELKTVLKENAAIPITLIGHSWGAWLSLILAAHYPDLVKKLILIGCGPLEEKYADTIMLTRLGRLSDNDKKVVEAALQTIDNPLAKDKNTALAKLGEILAKSDTYQPIPKSPDEAEVIECRGDIFGGVWKSAAAMRSSGELLRLAAKIKSPAVALHGDYDPHPAEGVRLPLSAIVNDFRFILLQHCGHAPWKERQARDEFYRVLIDELA